MRSLGQDHAVTSERFGSVHRPIGGVEELGRAARVLGKYGYAD
jgi:hypothetical protein